MALRWARWISLGLSFLSPWGSHQFSPLTFQISNCKMKSVCDYFCCSIQPWNLFVTKLAVNYPSIVSRLVRFTDASVGVFTNPMLIYSNLSDDNWIQKRLIHMDAFSTAGIAKQGSTSLPARNSLFIDWTNTSMGASLDILRLRHATHLYLAPSVP